MDCNARSVGFCMRMPQIAVGYANLATHMNSKEYNINELYINFL